MFKKCGIAIVSLIFGSGLAVSQAATLDFTEAGVIDFAGSTSVSLSNAELTSFGDDFFIAAPGSFGEANNLGVVCGIATGSACATDWEIVFNSAVSNLSFFSFGWESGDQVQIQAFDGLTLLQTIIVTANTKLNFTTLSSVTRLAFSDLGSLSSGIAFGDFLFDENAVVTPLPAALPLFLSGLIGAGIAGRRRRTAT